MLSLNIDNYICTAIYKFKHLIIGINYLILNAFMFEILRLKYNLRNISWFLKQNQLCLLVCLFSTLYNPKKIISILISIFLISAFILKNLKLHRRKA